jgi:hypothetical protein
MASADERQRLEELESAKSSAWWWRGAAERVAQRQLGRLPEKAATSRWLAGTSSSSINPPMMCWSKALRTPPSE